MHSSSFNRPSSIIACLVVILIFTTALPSRAAELNGTAQNIAQKPVNNKPDKVTLCHATGSDSNPYVEITVSANAATDGHGHAGHPDDIIPAPAGGCPTVLWPGGVAPAQPPPVAAPSTAAPTQPQPTVAAPSTAAPTPLPPSTAVPTEGQDQGGKPDKVTLCHATGSDSNPYVEITVSANAATDGHGHAGHPDDIIPAPAGGCPTVLWPGGVAPAQGQATTAAPSTVAPGQQQPTLSPPSTVAPGQPQPTVSAPLPFTPVAVASPVCVDWLVYSTNITGDWEIFRLGNLTDNPNADPNLTKGVGLNIDDISPSLSPDRRWIAFSSNRDGNWEIYIASTDGTVQQRVTHTTAQNSDPVWSPTGQSIAYESNRDGNWELYSVDVTSGVEKRLTYDSGNYVNASWSPDGTHLLFQSDRNGGLWQLYELNVATLNYRLKSDGQGDDLDPSYSFDGTRMVFRSLRDHLSAIYTMNLDGTNLTRISDPANHALNPTWSTDDSLIAYQSNLDGDMDIYAYEVASGKTRKVTDNPVDDYAPTWLCNAPTLVFASDVDGNPNLFGAPALPIDAAPLVVQNQAARMTSDSSIDRDPVNTPNSSDAGVPAALSPLLVDR